MKKTTLIFLAFTLAACQSSSEGATPTPQVTVTSEVTATLTSPVPTLTPVPALPAEIQELQKSLAGTDYGFKWNDDLKTLALTHTTPETEKTVVIPEIVFDENGNWKRTYTFETPYGTEAEVTIDSRVDKMTVTETPEGKKILDFSAWRLVDGKWERENIKGETSYNVAEAQFELQDNASEDPENKKGGVDKIPVYTSAVFPNATGKWFEGTVKLGGAYFDIKPTHSTTRWWGSDIKTVDSNNQPVDIKTTYYAVINFTNGSSVLIYKDKNNEYKTILIDANLTDWSNWSPRF